MISCHALGAHFYPDLGIASWSNPIFALEVKFLRGVSRQNSIATAIGQALVYSRRFHEAAVMLIDTEGRVSDDEILSADILLREARLPLIARRATRAADLAPHPAPEPLLLNVE